MKRLLFLGALLLPSLALAEATPVVIVGQPVQVAGTFTSSGAGNTIGSTATLNGNSVCATVWLAGQPGAGFDLATGTLATTLTPAVSGDATHSGNGCTGGTWTATGFTDPATGNSSSTLTVTNPNAGALLDVQVGSAVCARVCTAASGTSGTAAAFLIATAARAQPASSANVTDRAGRLLGVVYGSQGQQLQQTASNFNLRSELAVGATLIDPRAIRALTTSDAITASQGGSWTVGLTGTVPLPTGAATSALQTALNSLLPSVLDGTGGLKTHEQGTVAVTGSFFQGTQPISAGVLPLPTGAAADATLTGGTQKAIARGGAKGASTAADVTSTAEGTDHQALDVQLWLSGSALDPRTRSWTLNSGTDSVAAVQSGTWTATVSGTVTTTPPSNASTNISQINGVTVLTGSGVSGTGAQRTAVATSDGNTLATANTGRLQVDVVTGGGSNASVGATGSAVPSSATLVGGSKSGNTAALVLDASGNLNVNVAAGGASGGTSSSFGSAFPATGTAVGFKDSTGANLAAGNLDASGFLKVNVAAGGGSGGTSSTFGAASPGTGTAAGGLVTTAAPTYSTGNMGGLSLTTAGELRSIITSALPAGTNVIGHTIADTGSTTAVTSLPATPAGTNLIGKVGIDQTTPGTTNGVQVNAALPSGTNVIGHVIHDAGSTTAVTSLPAIPAGSNTIGAVTGPSAAALALDASVTALEVAQGSTTSGQKGILGLAAVSTSAPTLTNGQSSPPSMDTAGNLRMVWSGTGNMQGLGTAGAPSGGVLTVQPPSSGSTTFPVSGSLTPLDTAGTLVTLNTGCSTGVSCAAGSTALVQTAGQQGANVTFTTGSSPVFTVVADCATDGGTAWSLSGSPSTSGLVDFIAPGGVRSNTVVNPGNVSYQLVPQAGCIGTTYRVRIATASPTGSVNAQDRATAVAQPPYAGAFGANSYPSQAVAMMWRDPTTSTTSNPALGNATGELVQGAGANGATASGNPLRAGAIARATGAAPAQVTAGQTADLQSDLEHRLYVAAEHPNQFSCTVDAASAQTQCAGLSGSGLSYYIKSVTFSASATITFKVNSSTTAGNACATSPALVIPTMFFGANSGAPLPFPQPIRVTANSALCCLPSGASGSCIIAGYIAP